jgi:ABC-type sugar transport system ATPase subunit
MEEIFRLCDTVTVMRDGHHVATTPAADLNTADLVQMMIGRRLEEYFPSHVAGAAGEELLRVEGLTSVAGFRNVSFSVRAGEVVGLAGLVGAGRSEMAQALFGLDPLATGRVWVQGRPLHLRSPAESMRAGIGLVPEDRKRQGLVLSMSARANTTLAVLQSLARFSFIRHRAERALAASYFERLRVRAPGLDAATAGLSGGNQQKLVLAKWLAARSRVLILDEPTRGVDVGAKVEIYNLMNRLTARGAGIIMISSELPELLGMSDRILVMHRGRLHAEIAAADATEERVLSAALGLAHSTGSGQAHSTSSGQAS